MLELSVLKTLPRDQQIAELRTALDGGLSAAEVSAKAKQIALELPDGFFASSSHPVASAIAAPQTHAPGDPSLAGATAKAELKKFTGKPILRDRTIPEIAGDIIKVGDKLKLKRFAQSADMAGYVFHINGKPTYMYVLGKLSPATMLKPSGFLKHRKGLVLTDRDGPLDKTSSFLNKPDKGVTGAAMIPEALAASKALNEANVGLAIVTNQGGYQSGAMSFEDTVAVNVRVAQQIADAGGHVDAIFICPFSKALENAGADDVDARKPSAGMPLYAKLIAEKSKIPVLGLIGDQRTDGASAQGADLLFYAVTDTTNGRWEAELAAAKKKGEELPELDTDPSKMLEVHDFAAAVGDILANLEK
jgi:D-glycero-D-manno-heptose 1,7-bisphosphate phosphatase